MMQVGQPEQNEWFDPWLIGSVVMLLSIGLVMVTSSSLAYAEQQTNGNTFYYAVRHGVYLFLAIVASFLVLHIKIEHWHKYGPYLLVAGICLLVLVLGIGREVNGSRRAFALGPITVQASELMKLFVIIYLAGYLVRKTDELQTQIKGFIKPVLILSLIVGFLIMEPDFGAAAVIVATCLAMMFLAGARLWQFIGLTSCVAVALGAVAISQPYRYQRLLTFIDPWADKFGSGYQLTQSLIAFGRGEWFGQGLGNSMQKLSYLPEAHTDFVFAVLAEELGFVGVLVVLALFLIFFIRGMKVGQQALHMEQAFAAYLAYGISFWLAIQAMINIGVSSGALPTKGLTLPFVSYGGNSLIIACVAVAILLRIDFEVRLKKLEFERIKRPS